MSQERCKGGNPIYTSYNDLENKPFNLIGPDGTRGSAMLNKPIIKDPDDEAACFITEEMKKPGFSAPLAPSTLAGPCYKCGRECFVRKGNRPTT